MGRRAAREKFETTVSNYIAHNHMNHEKIYNPDVERHNEDENGQEEGLN